MGSARTLYDVLVLQHVRLADGVAAADALALVRRPHRHVLVRSGRAEHRPVRRAEDAPVADAAKQADKYMIKTHQSISLI